MLGRPRQSRVGVIGAVRELTPAEASELGPRERKPAVKRWREIHHMIARLFVSGMSISEIAETTGYSYQRIMTYQNDPAFQELLAQKREVAEREHAVGIQDFVSLATGNMLKAERQLAKKIEDADEEGEALPTRELVSIVSDRADRFGYSKRSTNFNVNLDFADLLGKRLAKQRSATLVEGNSPALDVSNPQLALPPTRGEGREVPKSVEPSS